MNRCGVLVVLVMFVIFALTLGNALAVAQAQPTISFDLVPASAAVATCLPYATAHVTVALKEDTQGTDTLHLTARNLPPDTDFAVFLTSADAFATPPFGAVQYIGDFTTNAAGVGKVKIQAIVAEAFVSTLVNSSRLREDLDHLVFWFADPNQAQAACGLRNTTVFDGDGHAGPAAMSSQGATGLEQFPE